jgi:hypothetical protein
LRSENELTSLDALEPESAALIEREAENLCVKLH